MILVIYDAHVEYVGCVLKTRIAEPKPTCDRTAYRQARAVDLSSAPRG